MNITSLTHRNVSARFFAGITILSLLMSAVPVAFYTATAATDLVGPASKTINATDPYGSGVVDASVFSNLTFSFDYDSTELDGTDDSFTYGWRDAGGDKDLGTVVGLVGATAAEIDSISVPLPAEALVADLEVYVYSTAIPGNESDEVKLSNILVAGDLTPVPVTAELRIVKEVAGGTAVPADWEMTATADGNEYDFTDNGDSEEFHAVAADLPYIMSESEVADYELTSIECDGGTQDGSEITLAEDESVTCVFINTYKVIEVIDDTEDTVVYGCMDETANNYNADATEAGEVVCTYDEDTEDEGSNEEDNGGGNNNGGYDWSLCEDGPDWLDNPYWAHPGKKKDGSDITDPNRTNPNVVLGEPDWTSGGITGFYSLGFGGFFIVDFYNYVLDVDGVDLTIHEATNGNYPLEQAEVWVSQTGGDWKYVGLADNTAPDRVTSLDFSNTGLPWIQFVKLVDVSDPDLHNNDADGFDLDAVGATMAVCSEPGKVCPDDECLAEVEARVVLQAGEVIANNGDGNLKPQVILGDGSVVPFGQWFKLSEAQNPGDSAEWIDDPSTVTDYANPEDLEGLFVSREGNGKVRVALYGFHNPGGDANYESLRATIEFNDATVKSGATHQINGNFKLENHSETDKVVSNDNFDSFAELGDLTGVNFNFWVDTKADGIVVTLDDEKAVECDDDTDPRDPVDDNEETYLIGGYKYEVDGENNTPKAGWNIYAYNNDDATSLATTTDSNGAYYFDVEAGDWEITEEVLADWDQVSVWQNGEIVETEGENVGYCEFDSFSEEGFYHCDFYNEYVGSSDDDNGDEDVDENDEGDSSNDEDTNRRGGSSSGTKLRHTTQVPTPTPTPYVLGASTSQCGMLLHDYMKIGSVNKPYEVRMLQYFLNGQGFYVPVTGFFGPLTDKAVKDFQMSYQAEVLTPWQKAGIVDHNNPTGYEYLLTRWKINNIFCPGSEPLPELVP